MGRPFSQYLQTLWTASGKETWGPLNRMMHYDDVLYAVVFAYICRQSFPNLGATQVNVIASSTRTRYKLVRDGSGNLTRRAVRESVFETVDDIPDIR